MSFSKRGTMLLIKTRMHACEFKRFIDFVLIDKRVPNPDSHRQWRTRPEGAAAPPAWNFQGKRKLLKYFEW